MKTLYDYFQVILKDKKKWQYYDDMKIYDNIETIMKNPEKFIKDYLEIGGKTTDELEILIEVINKKNPERLQHTISIFLLGLILYNNFTKIEKEIDKFIDERSKEVNTRKIIVKKHFNYWWFLICFIHDIGYAYNKNSVGFKLFGINAENEIRIEEEVKSNLKSIENFSKDCVPQIIIDVWRRYLKYRKEMYMLKKSDEKIDHGILSGAYYIYTLNEVYNKKKNSNQKELDENNGFIDKNRLYWSPKMIDCVHKPIAWIIVYHNIWYKNKNYEDTKEYEQKKLNELIIKKPLIKLDRYPLYFLLCLVDTLDPVKFIINNDSGVNEVRQILKNTLLSLNNNMINIKFINELKKYNKCYIEKNSTIDSWLDIIIDNKFHLK